MERELVTSVCFMLSSKDYECEPSEGLDSDTSLSSALESGKSCTAHDWLKEAPTKLHVQL